MIEYFKTKIKVITGLLIIGVTLNCLAQEKHAYKYSMAKAGEIRPEGWIKKQMERDLQIGLIGNYDKISNTVAHNLFVTQNRVNNKTYDNWKEWWSGEHEAYWKDAVIRMAYLTGNKQYMDSAKVWVDDIISHIGPSGYIGIYAEGETPHNRYNFSAPNGELWTQSRIMVALAAYYEFTGDKRVFDHLKKAVRLTMKKYDKKNPFDTKKDGGTGHGVGYFEILEWLYRATGNMDYAEFAKKLYVDLERVNSFVDDLTPKRLSIKELYFANHGPHIVEGFLAPFWLKSLYGNPSYDLYCKNAIYKLNYATTPSGAMRSDEFVRKRKGTANEGYEYCSIAELINPFNCMIGFTGDMELADRTERAVFNAAQGARFGDLSAISYLTRDNRINIDPKENHGRYTFDSNHGAASCCSLNSGRVMPYYVQGMWMNNIDESEIFAVMFGPSSYSTNLQGTDVVVKEQTDYPFGDSINFILTVEKPKLFTFSFRKPFGVKSIDISGIEGARIDSTQTTVSLTKVWKSGDKISVNFDFNIEQIADIDSKGNKEYYLQRGPLVYALDFTFVRRKMKEHKKSGFYQWDVSPVDTTGWNYQWYRDSSLEFERNEEMVNTLFPFDKNKQPLIRINTNLKNNKGQKVPVSMVPMGTTLLRRVTFPMAP